MLRVAELVRHAMSDLLTRSAIADPALEGKVVTVPDVRMSPDLKLATVYVMPLGGENVQDTLTALERHKKYLRGEIARRVNLRFAPEIRFKADPSFDQRCEIDALLASPKVRQDLETRSDLEPATGADPADRPAGGSE
jgi:ribosome-binding factor A